MKKKYANTEKLVSMIERDHGGCDQNTCTLGIALRHGYDLVAIDSWIGSGASSNDFNKEVEKGLSFSLKEVDKQSKQMTKEVNHIECKECNSVLWEPEWCGYNCDSCGNDIDKSEK